MNKHRVFFTNTAWQLLLQVVKYLFPLITLPYLARVLEPEGYAVYAFVVSFMTIARVFVEYGFNLSGTKRIAQSGDVAEKNEVVGAITLARVLLCAIAGIVVVVVASNIPLLNGYLIYTVLSYLGVCVVALAPDFLFMGHEHMKPLTTRYLISKAVPTALVFVLVRSVDDLLWVPILEIAAGIIALVWSYVVGRRQFGTTIAMVPLYDVLNELKASGFYCFSNVASTMLTSFTTLFVGVVISDPAQVSY